MARRRLLARAQNLIGIIWYMATKDGIEARGQVFILNHFSRGTSIDIPAEMPTISCATNTPPLGAVVA
jgi:hypothetical protein